MKIKISESLYGTTFVASEFKEEKLRQVVEIIKEVTSEKVEYFWDHAFKILNDPAYKHDQTILVNKKELNNYL